jgi:hypothetical protein
VFISNDMKNYPNNSILEPAEPRLQKISSKSCAKPCKTLARLGRNLRRTCLVYQMVCDMSLFPKHLSPVTIGRYIPSKQFNPNEHGMRNMHPYKTFTFTFLQTAERGIVF